jgi:hypothetical protein
MLQGTRALLLILLTFGLAGCSDGADSQETGTNGRAADGPADGADSALEAEASTRPTQVEPFEWDGSIGTMAYACGPVGCQGTGLPTGWEQSLDLDGLFAIDVEMTFDAAPGQELAFGLATACDGPCDFVTYSSGSGSIRLEADGLDPDHTYTLVAWHPYQSAMVGGAQAGVETAFHVTGELTTLA